MTTDAIVIGVGEKSFTVLILELGIEMRLFVDQMDGITSSFDKENQKITLVSSSSSSSSSKSSKGRSPEFDRLVIGLMSPVVVYVSAKETPPIDIRVTVIREGYSNTNDNSNEEVPSSVFSDLKISK